MLPNLAPSEQLTYSTARIECETDEGPASGTGFFYKFLDDGEKHVPAVVTNRHVVSGARRGKFHLTVRGPDGGPHTWRGTAGCGIACPF